MDFFITDEERKDRDMKSVRDQVTKYRKHLITANNGEQFASAVPDSAEIINKNGYMVAWDETNQEQFFVGYTIGPESDPELKKRWQMNTEFTNPEGQAGEFNFEAVAGTGQQRGHIAGQKAVGTTGGAEGKAQSFEGANISAHRREFNVGIYRELEQSFIKKAEKEGLTYYVLAGSIPTTELIGNPKDGYQKNPDKHWAIYYQVKDGKFFPEAFIIDEDTAVRSNYESQRTTVDRISEIRGMDIRQIIGMEQGKKQ